jgi:hypothetical protein
MNPPPHSRLLERSASSIAELYRQRWNIELFFRWLKANANFSRLCSHHRKGVSLAFHAAVIAALSTTGTVTTGPQTRGAKISLKPPGEIARGNRLAPPRAPTDPSHQATPPRS